MCSLKNRVLKRFANFTGKHLCRSLFNKVAGLQACNFIKNKLQRRCFPMRSGKFQKKEEHLRRTVSVVKCEKICVRDLCSPNCSCIYRRCFT